MKNEENMVGLLSSLPYSTELIDKSYCIPAKIKKLMILLDNHSSQNREKRSFERQIIDELRREIIDDLFYICYNLNQSEILGNNMIKLSNTSRYDWSGRGLDPR
jgi:hypothetical protein